MNNILATILFVLATPFAAIAATPWESYLAHPTPKAAGDVHEITYSPSANGMARDNALDLQVLALQVYAGDVEALRLTLRLASRSDGGLLEDLYAIAGHSIRAHPHIFLKSMVDEKLTQESIKWIVNMAGLEYVDRPDARRYELQQRAAALASVRDKRLSFVRAACLKALREGNL